MKKYISVLVSFFMAIGLVSAKPLVVHADTIPNNEPSSYNYYVDMVSTTDPFSITTQSGSTQVVKKYCELVINGNLYNQYVGYITVLVNYSYQGYDYDSSLGYNVRKPITYVTSHTVSVNGNSFEWHDNFNFSDVASNNINVSINSLSISSSNVVLKDELYNLTIDEIIPILTNIYDNTDDLLSVLQSIKGDSEILTLMRQFNVFYESFNVLIQPFRVFTIVNDSYYYNSRYPVFAGINNKVFLYQRMVANEDYYFIWLYRNTSTTVDSVAKFQQYISVPSGVTIKKVETLQYVEGYSMIQRVTMNASSTGWKSFKFISNCDYFSPIYFDKVSNKNISTDFALLFGLSNNLLDNLDIIASGTNQSNNSSSSLENSTSNFNDEASDMFDLENDFNQNLNDSLDDIDPDFSFDNSFGSKFLNSAEFVKDQFDLLTENNAFGSLLSFSLLLGLGLLILGKIL